MTVDEYVEIAARAEPLGEAFREDVDEHLSTLFPPVRPRGTYLEFRALDVLPLPGVRMATILLACLLGYPPSVDAAENLLHGVDQRELWDHAAGPGIRVPAVRDLATRLVDLASVTIHDVPSAYLPTSARRRTSGHHAHQKDSSHDPACNETCNEIRVANRANGPSMPIGGLPISRICWVPPAGFEPALPPPEDG